MIRKRNGFMEKIVIRKFGKAHTLKTENFPDIDPQSLSSDEVLIDIYYSGINFADIVMRLGFYQDAPKKPFIPGYEYSGKVLAVGSAVASLKEGDEVYGGCVFGGYSSQLKMKEWQVIKIPNHLDLKESAGLPVAFITAYTALYDMARIRKGDKVLIDCATGGVGTLALQMLKNLEAKAIGLTSSPHKKELIESYGAKAMTNEEFENSSERNFDFILNSSGGATIKKQFKRLKPTGRILCLGVSDGIKDGKRSFGAFLKTVLTMPKFSVISLFAENKGVYALNALHLIQNDDSQKEFMDNFNKAESMNLRPLIGDVFPASNVGDAHRNIELRKSKGKVLLSWKN